MDTAIHIGANLATVKEARAAILEIVRCSVGDSVKVTALETLTKICAVENPTVTNCTFTAMPSGEVKVKKRRTKPNGA